MNEAEQVFSFRQSRDAPHELRQLVRGLCAARYRQLILEAGSRVLVWTAVACGVAIALTKSMQLGISIGAIVGVAFVLGMLVLSIGAWRQRPDPLAVVIDTDLRLGLRQILSTAWELSSVGRLRAEYELLCRQVLRLRLPAKAERVYPLRATVHTWIAPIAIVGMLLVWFVDWAPARLAGQASGVPSPTDSVGEVIATGEKLWVFSTELRAEAHRRGLERSRRTAEDLQRIASRMQSGRETTTRALAHLAQLRQRVGSRMRDAAAAGIDLGDRRSTGAPSARTIPRDLLSRIATSRLTEGDARRLMEATQRSGSGLSPSQLRSAIDSYFRGDQQALRDWAEDSGQAEAIADAAALQRAYAALNEAQERLGARSGSGGLPRGLVGTAPGGAGSQVSEATGTDSENQLFDDEDAVDDGEQSDDDQNTAGNERGNTRGYVARGFERTPAEGEAIRPRSQHGAGPVLRATTRALPRDNSDAVEFSASRSAADAMTAQQQTDSLEQALSNQQVPARYRSYVRDYFRIVSDGARSAQEGSR